jgi:hypothetical protein
LEGELVDEHCVEVVAFLELTVAVAESLVVCLQVSDLGFQVLEGWREFARGLGSPLEVVREVGVLMGQDPALDPGLGGELDDGEGSS